MSRWRELHDQVIAENIHDMLAHDRRTDVQALAIDVRGGVAHVRGRVGSAAERRLLRALIGRVRGVYAVWDLLRMPEEGTPRVLDLGCGNTKQWDWTTGVDCEPLGAVNVLADLEHGLPFADASIDAIFAVHVLEHLHNLLPLMADIHRVLKPEGILHVMVPHWQHVIAVADPTHVRFFSPQTFENLCYPRSVRHCFRPLLVSSCEDTIYADLQPIAATDASCHDAALACFFR